MTAHRITYTAKHGAHQVVRIHGAPDRDMAVMYIEKSGGTVSMAEVVNDDAPRVWGEQSVEFAY
jgi:hypothetical protein